ncbi:NAD(P)-dependent oxidoreductase [Metallibacterium sp.]|uniref:NAD(P)-dependent oxidoreductase n=1 Tax=Metallibacterium sp. TaxID=2940281 RepID=UPI002617F8A6|nr:NAD(P)-dependent oxidoreductase [Metallibacterium sp.]
MTHRSAGFIGLGAMGLPMARHLHAHGLLAAVGNRSAAKAQALAAELGVAAPGTLAQLAAQCTRIAMCVTADADVLGCVAALRPGLRKDAIVIDHSTVAPETAQRAAALLAEVGAHFLDAPVSGGVEGARNGKLSVMVGGDEAMLERARPLLECYAARITWMGSSGSGQATKAVNQVLVAGIAAAVCEGLALGAALGLAPERLLPTLAAGAAGNWFLDRRGASMLRGEFDVGFKLALLHKDLGIVQRIARGAGCDHSVIDKALVDYARLMAQGHGDEDISALIRLKHAR